MRALALIVGLLSLVPAAASAPVPNAPLPKGWPRTFELGLADAPGGAAALRKSVPLRFRYQYLAGGANTGQGWATWNDGGTFVSRYVRESVAAGLVPVFPYYMIRQSAPGKDDGDEPRAVLSNLRNDATMKSLLVDLELFFRRAGAFRSTTVVLHLEPDLWGYGEQVARDDDARTVPAGAGLATLAGFAQAVVRLRDRLAPNVLLAYHVSVWGTKVDISISDPPAPEVDRLAARAARFYRSLGARFDIAFADPSDRDSAFKQKIYGAGGEAWWTPADFRRNARFLRGFSRATGLRLVLWQIPLGNTLMRAMDNTWGHFQDNRVQWWLGPGGRAHVRELAAAGVVALLFGGGADGTTCACDARRDGVTNPRPLNGNTRRSWTADDDGGYFRAQARAYYRLGALRLAP